MSNANTLATRRAAYDSALAAISTLTGSELDNELDRLAGEERAIASLEAAEASIARSAAAAGRAPAILSRRTETTALKPGTHLARFAIARSVAQESKRRLDDVAEAMFGKSSPEVVAIARAAVGVADSTTQGWAAELVKSETRAMLETDLVGMSIWARLASIGLSVNFAGAASVVVPQLNVGTTQDGAWVGEGGAIPLVQGDIGAARLHRYKLGGIIPITKELQRTSDPSAVEVMRQLLLRVISNLLDGSLISANAAVQGVRPDGILVGVVAIPPTPAGGVNAVTEDIKALITAMFAANVGVKPVLIVNSATLLSLGLMTNALGEFVFRSEVAGGKLLMVPIIGSPMVPTDRVIAVDAEYFASAIDEAEIDISEDATIVAADSGAAGPTHAGDSPGGGALGTPHQIVPRGGIPILGGSGASVAGAVAVSLWQTWSLGIRVVLPASFKVTRAGAVQLIDGITW